MTFEWLKKEFQLKNFFFVDCQPERFYKSQWSSKRWIFLGIKVLLMAYWFSWFVADLVFTNILPRWWIYLTNWGVLTLLIYFLVSAALTSYGLITRNDSSIQNIPIEYPTSTAIDVQESTTQSNINAPDCELRWFHKLVWMFQTASMSGAIIITVLYWALLTPDTSAFSVNNHAINTVIIILDFCLNDIPVRIFHFIFISFFGLSYTIFSLILHWSGYESAIYPVLDWATQPGVSAGLCAIVIFVISPVLQLLIYALYRLRVYIASKFGITSTFTETAIAMTPSVEGGISNPTFLE